MGQCLGRAPTERPPQDRRTDCRLGQTGLVLPGKWLPEQRNVCRHREACPRLSL